MFTSKISKALALSGAVVGITASALFVSAQVGGSLNPVTALKAMVAGVAKSCYTPADIAALESKKAELTSRYMELSTESERYSIRLRDIERSASNAAFAPALTIQRDLDRLQANHDQLVAKKNRTARDDREIRDLAAQIKTMQDLSSRAAAQRPPQPTEAEIAELRAKSAQSRAAVNGIVTQISSVTTELANAKKKSCVCIKQADYDSLQAYQSQLSSLPAQVGAKKQAIAKAESDIFAIEARIKELKFYYADYSDTKTKVAQKQTELAAVKKTLAADKAALKKLEGDLKKAQTEQPKLATKLAASGGFICGGATIQLAGTAEEAYLQQLRAQYAKLTGVQVSLRDPGATGSGNSAGGSGPGGSGNGSMPPPGTWDDIKNVPATPYNPLVVPDCSAMINNHRLVWMPLGTTVDDFNKAPGWVPLAQGQTVGWRYRTDSETAQQYVIYCSYGAMAQYPISEKNERAVPYNPEVHACVDGIDNDADGLIDRADTRDCPTPTGEICNDGIDNDGDGYVDGDDPDCQDDREEDCRYADACDSNCPQYNPAQCQD